MTPQQKADAEKRAQAYIDEIMKINRKYGMGDSVSEDTYRHAVEGSAEVFKGLLAQPIPPAGS